MIFSRMKHKENVDWKFRIVIGTYERNLYGLDVYPLKEDSKKLALKPIFIVSAHLGCVKEVAANGPILASGGSDEVIRLFDLRRKKELGSLHQHHGSITTMRFYGVSHMLSGGEDGTICIWRTSDWECLKVLKGHRGVVHSLSIHSSGKVALSVGKDPFLCMWDLLKGRLAFKKKLPWMGDKIEFSPDGIYFSIVSENLIQWYQTEDVVLLHEIKHDKRIHATCWYKVSVLSYYIISSLRHVVIY
jgi:protein MAK11